MDGSRFRTSDYLTRFEFARCVGLRILQLTTHGKLPENPETIALREILEGINPAVVRRRLPDGTHEDRAIAELKISRSIREQCETHFGNA